MVRLEVQWIGIGGGPFASSPREVKGESAPKRLRIPSPSIHPGFLRLEAAVVRLEVQWIGIGGGPFASSPRRGEG